MKSVIRYRTKAASADENRQLVENVYKELAERDPGGLRYATLLLDDGVSFVHIFMTDSEEGSGSMGSIQAFAEFQRELAQRCEEQPVAQSVTVIGSYRLFESQH